MHSPHRHAQVPKCHGPRALKGYTLNGYEIIILENEFLRAVINVGRGAMVHELQYKPKDIDILFKTPGGLRQHDSYTVSSYATDPLRDFHPGGWYECFPSGSSAVYQEGAHIGFHGEIWGQPFELNSVTESDEGCAATMTAYTVRTPWQLVKTFSLKRNDPTLYLEETATNLGGVDLTVMWGQHPFYGAPFVDGNAYVEVPATSFFDHSDKPMVRLRWPEKEGRNFSKVGKPGSSDGKMIFITDFPEGKYRLVSPTFKLAAEMRWDAAKFPYCWLYETCNQPTAFWGRAYGVAIEPFTGLPKAIEEGHGVIKIPARKSETVKFSLGILPV